MFMLLILDMQVEKSCSLLYPGVHVMFSEATSQIIRRHVRKQTGTLNKLQYQGSDRPTAATGKKLATKEKDQSEKYWAY